MIYLFDRQKKLQKIIPKKHLLSAIQTVELNGLYQLSVEVPLFYETKEGTQYNHKKNVEKAWFAGHYDRQKRFQLYKIHSRKVRAEAKQTLVFDGVHIFFDEAKAMGNIHDRRFRDTEMKPAADAAFNPIGWYVKDYDVTDRADITFYRDSVANARSLIIEKFGVEFDYGLTFNGRKIISKDLYIKKRLGRWTGKRFAYGSNLLSLTQEEDESEVYTAAVGRGRGEESGEGHGPRIEFTDIEWSKDGITKPPGQNYIEIPSATAEYGYYENGEIHPRIASEVVFENTENKQLLADSTYYWLLENCVPKALWKTDVAKADVHDLGDGVGVIYKKANIIKKARVHKMENNLLDHRLSKIILGDYQHFKTDKRQQSISAQLKRNRNDTQSYITQLKNDFDVRYDAQATAIENAYQQAVIDANAETAAAEQRMQTELNTQRNEIETAIETSRTNAINAATDYSDALEAQLTQDIATQRTELLGAIDTARTEAISQAEQDAEAKAGQVQSNLETFKGEHEALYNEITGNISDIDTFLGDKSTTLRQQFESVQNDLLSVEGELGSTREALQKQLDDAKAELDGLEVGGRNLFSTSVFIETHSYPNGKYENDSGKLVILDVDQSGTSSYGSIANLKPNQSYIMSFSERMNDRFVYYDESGEGASPETKVWNFDNTILQIKTGDSQLEMRGKFYPISTDYPYTVEIQIEEGNKATSWEAPPEDTEQKITTLNQQIDFIDGQLSAKLEQTDIEPLQSKITEYGLELDANAESIGLLQDKTELHDDDITTWSNETKLNSDSITAMLTRVSDTESGLEQAQADISASADEISALLTKTDGHESQLSSFTQTVDSIETTVAGHDDWFNTHGSNAEQTIAGFERKAWLDDIVNPNLLSHTDITKVENRRQWSSFNAGVTGLTYGEYMRVRNTAAGSTLGIRSPNLALVEGEQYTLSFTAFVENASVSEHFNYCYVFSPLGNYKVNNPTFTVVETPTGSYGGNTVRQYKLTFTAARNEEQAQIMIGSRTTETGIDASFAFKHPKLEMDTRATAYHTSFMSIEERADLIRLQVQDIEGDYVKQSGVSVTGGQVNIGSVQIGDDELASILSVSPQTVDVITEKMRITGDLAVAGDIESLAVSAVTADFAEIFADVADIGFIKGNHIETNSINVDHLTGADAILGLLMARTVFSEEVKTLSIEAAKANFGEIVAGTADIDFINGSHIEATSIVSKHLALESATMERLVARTIFTDAVFAKSIEAVHADLTSVTSEIMTTNILKSEWLKVDTALFERFTANEAFIDRLVVKAANVRDLEAITIDAVQANLTTVMNSMGEVEGGLTIRRPDGALFIENGLQKFGQPIQLVEYRSDGVEWNGQTYDTSRRGTQIFQTAYTDHSGRYANFSFRVGLRWDSPSASDHIAVLVRPGNVPSGVSLQNYYEERTIVYRDSGLKSLTINVPLPRPTYGALSFTLEFYNVATINQGSIVQVRPTRAWISA
ncbi:phage tail spike protein [Salinicoccus roseus]|uniref:Phage tail protein n=1 Tax=Salinicoccus roseus TaxID=45670 RepID=A0A0C2E3D1_9STAP|nr:phage tail spike protein [Salinicoccus roseus]KIH69947.1 hypothetical protein SN16_10575 [Salinicoccus roseus]MDB0581244.1 phage tail protein [Salinicoccus roseus]